MAIGQRLGWPEDMIEGLGVSGAVHDIGKIAVPTEILNRTAKLSTLEYGIVKTHPEAGHSILSGIEFPWPIATAILQHHERMDGSGYPYGLKGAGIIPEARVLAVALVAPCLTLFADIVGVAGGCIVAAASLDLTPTTYFNQVQKILEVSDVLKGLTKSFAYGIEVAMIGCLRGFQVRGGAESVGSAATSAVVTSVFVIVVTDAIFSMLFHYVRLL